MSSGKTAFSHPRQPRTRTAAATGNAITIKVISPMSLLRTDLSILSGFLRHGRCVHLRPVPDRDNPHGALLHPMEESIRRDDHLAMRERRELGELSARPRVSVQ